MHPYIALYMCIMNNYYQPENLLCDAAGNDCTIKICDFGFAKRDTGNALETPLGTVAYVGTCILLGQSTTIIVDEKSDGSVR